MSGILLNFYLTVVLLSEVVSFCKHNFRLFIWGWAHQLEIGYNLISSHF
jgi:hypothetical protein